MGAGRAWAHSSGIRFWLATATAADSILQSKLTCALPWGCQLCPPTVYFTPDRTCHEKTPTPPSGGRPRGWGEAFWSWDPTVHEWCSRRTKDWCREGGLSHVSFPQGLLEWQFSNLLVSGPHSHSMIEDSKKNLFCGLYLSAFTISEFKKEEFKSIKIH